MAKFVQILEFDTSHIDEVEALASKMDAERGATQLARRATITADRDRPRHYFVIVEFDSYESAMENSNNPVTQHYSQEMAKLFDGPPTFHNLDVVAVQELGTGA